MASFFYYATAIAESGLSVVGIRSPYDQPRYQVVRDVAPGIEIRAYAPRVAVETTMQDGNDGEAFGRLFRYITGANTGKHSISMTVPVEEASQAIPMTKPVEQAGSVMRFFLPPSVANAPPHPTDPAVRIVTLPSTEFAVIRYSGSISDKAKAKELAQLRAALAKAGVQTEGEPSYLSYDPPFALPFVRRNEVALAVKP